jgi:hypothetical protein
MLPALAFLPVHRVPTAFAELNRLVFADHLLDLLAYFEKYYIGEPLGNGIIKNFKYKNIGDKKFEINR